MHETLSEEEFKALSLYGKFITNLLSGYKGQVGCTADCQPWTMDREQIWRKKSLLFRAGFFMETILNYLFFSRSLISVSNI